MPGPSSPSQTHSDPPRLSAAAGRLGPSSRYANRPGYLSWVEIELKDDLSFVPRFDTTAMIASKIPGGDQPVFDRCCGRFVFQKAD